MKKGIIFIFSLTILGFFSCAVQAQQNQQEINEELEEIMADSVKRNMAMQMIAEESKMRQDMMSHLRKQMMREMDGMQATEMIEKMRNRLDQEMRMKRMRMHREMMRAMMNEEEILQKMDGDKDMKNMMIWHMMWMDMMYDNDESLESR